jgi:hypothetical protein
MAQPTMGGIWRRARGIHFDLIFWAAQDEKRMTMNWRTPNGMFSKADVYGTSAWVPKIWRKRFSDTESDTDSDSDTCTHTHTHTHTDTHIFIKTKVVDECRAKGTSHGGTSVDTKCDPHKPQRLDVIKHLEHMGPLELVVADTSVVGPKTFDGLELVLGREEAGVGDGRVHEPPHKRRGDDGEETADDEEGLPRVDCAARLDVAPAYDTSSSAFVLYSYWYTGTLVTVESRCWRPTEREGGVHLLRQRGVFEGDWHRGEECGTG